MVDSRLVKPKAYGFESRSDYTGYLMPGSRVTTIGEFGISREWWCKIRGTYNGRVPKKKKQDEWVIIHWYKSLPI